MFLCNCATFDESAVQRKVFSTKKAATHVGIRGCVLWYWHRTRVASLPNKQANSIFLRLLSLTSQRQQTYTSKPPLHIISSSSTHQWSKKIIRSIDCCWQWILVISNSPPLNHWSPIMQSIILTTTMVANQTADHTNRIILKLYSVGWQDWLVVTSNVLNDKRIHNNLNLNELMWIIMQWEKQHATISRINQYIERVSGMWLFWVNP